MHIQERPAAGGGTCTGCDTAIELQQIIPTIKSRDWLGSQRQASGFDPLVEPYNADLVIIYADFRDTSTSTTPGESTRRWAIKLQMMFTQSCAVQARSMSSVNR